MRFSSFGTPACFLALASLALADAAASDVPSDVLKLTAATFEEAVSGNPLILVEFFAPW